MGKMFSKSIRQFLGDLFLDNLNKRLDNFDERFDSIDKRLTKNEIADLRQDIYNEGLTLEERVNAGCEYLELGGNGSAGIKVAQLKMQLEDKIMGRH